MDDDLGRLYDLAHAYQYCVENGDRTGQNVILEQAAPIVHQMGDWRLEQAASTLHEMGDWRAVARFLAFIGKVYVDLRDFGRALTYLEHSLRSVQRVEDQALEVSILFDIAEVYVQLQDLNKALEALNYALSLIRERGFRHDEGVVLAKMGEVHRQLRDRTGSWDNYAEALRYSERALEISRGTGDRSSELTALYNLGRLQMDSGDDHKAVSYLEEAMAIYERLGYEPPTEQRHLLNMARRKVSDAVDSSQAQTGTFAEKRATRRRRVGDAVVASQTRTTAYFQATMRTSIKLDTARVPVVVIVSREEIGLNKSKASTSGRGEVDPRGSIELLIIPRENLEAIGSQKKVILVPDPGKPHRSTFYVRPTARGKASLLITAFQGAIPICTLQLKSRVVVRPRSAKRSQSAGQGAYSPPRKPLITLRIHEEPRAEGQRAYVYELATSDFDVLEGGESSPMRERPEDYVNNFFKRIELIWSECRNDFDLFSPHLRALGGELWDQLVPPRLQQKIWEMRSRIKSILVIATEPFVPWELLHLKEPGQPLPDETLFLGQLGLVRWLCDGGGIPEQFRVRPGRARYAIPEYAEARLALPEAVEERRFLEENFAATPVEAETTAVRKLLGQAGGFDLFHFVGHGVRDPARLDGTRLLMTGPLINGKQADVLLDASLVRQFARLEGKDGSRPIVMLNACYSGAAEWRLTHMGGFAQAFLSQRAGAFIGTLWSVGDRPSRLFVETFYRELLDSATIAEAARAAREATRAADSASWLAYVVYGHPHAQLQRLAPE